MKKIKILIILSALIILNPIGKLFSQVLEAPTPIVNRAWEKTEIDPKRGHNANRKAIQYPYLREADVMWAKRIWRQMDLREKMNYYFYYPNPEVRDRISFMKILWNAVTKGGQEVLPAYEDEDFTQPLVPTQVIAKFMKNDSISVKSAVNPDIDSMVVTHEEFKPENVKKFLIKEDWFFDRQRSVMEVRIIGICPVIDEYTADPTTGELSFKGLKPVFWIYFPHARPLFAKMECFNNHNDAERRTFDDIFQKRLFSSFVYKEENVYDRQIKDYYINLDALLEAERVKNDLFVMEHDLWEY